MEKEGSLIYLLITTITIFMMINAIINVIVPSIVATWLAKSGDSLLTQSFLITTNLFFSLSNSIFH